MKQKPKKSSNQPTDNKDFERLGRLLKEIYEIEFMDLRRFYKMNFIRGLLIGFGSVLGATILITILLMILNVFDQIPVVGPLFESSREIIRENGM